MGRQLAAVQQDDDKDSVVNSKRGRTPGRRSSPLDSGSRNHDKSASDISQDGPVRKVVGHGLTKGALFMCAGVLLHRFATIDEYDLHGRGRAIPVVGVMMAVGALLLAVFCLGSGVTLTFIAVTARRHAREAHGLARLQADSRALDAKIAALHSGDRQIGEICRHLASARTYQLRMLTAAGESLATGGERRLPEPGGQTDLVDAYEQSRVNEQSLDFANQTLDNARKQLQR